MDIKQHSKEHPDYSNLTSRETEVLRLLLDGKNTRQISFTMTCATRTVEIHVHNIMEKLGIDNPEDLYRLPPIPVE